MAIVKEAVAVDVEVTVVVTVETLSAGVLSAAALSTVAVFTLAPSVLSFAVSVSVLVLLAGSEAMVAVATFPAVLKVVPAGPPVSLTNVAPAGRTSSTTTLVAAAVPVPAVTTSV